jgi:hypothetical protein
LAGTDRRNSSNNVTWCHRNGTSLQQLILSRSKWITWWSIVGVCPHWKLWPALLLLSHCTKQENEHDFFPKDNRIMKRAK